jgi:hypothetical protein
VCANVSKLRPEEDACAFVRAHCESGHFFDYLQIYYCHVRPLGFVAQALMMASGSCAFFLSFFHELVLFRCGVAASGKYASSRAICVLNFQL